MDNKTRLVAQLSAASARRIALFATVFACALFWTLLTPAHPVAAQAGALAGQVVRIDVASQADVNALAADLDVWQVDLAGGAVVAWVSDAQLTALRAQGYTATVEPQLNRLVADAVVRAAGAQDAAGIPGFACYRTVEETYTDLDALAVAYPDLASWTDIGDSWAKEQGSGGYDIFALRLTNDAIPGPKPKFILMAAIHAREYTTAELATRFAERLLAGYGVDPDITWLLDYHELHLIPQANPDGRKRAEAGALWRKNVNSDVAAFCPSSAYGVDLNRNSSFRWNQCDGFSCSSSFACDLTYRGPSPASEPETRVIQDYVSSILPDRRGEALTDAAPLDTESLFISLHSYSELILFPWGWSSKPSPNFTGLQTLGRKFGYFTGYEVCQAGSSGCLYQTDGTTDDWSYGTLGVASYTFELGTWFFESCTFFEGNIVDRGMDSLMYAFKAARRPYETPAGPEIVDLAVDGVGAGSLDVAPGALLNLRAVADDTRYASNSPAQDDEPVQTIAGARYTVDAPSWITGTVAYSMTAPVVPATTATLTATVDTQGWAAGRHTIFVEAQDSDGNWGVPTAVFVDVRADYALALGGATSGRVAPGKTVTYTLTLTNTGVMTDSYAVLHMLPPDLAWNVDASPSDIVDLPPGGAAQILATVTVPAAAPPGQAATTTVRVQSATEESVRADLEIVTTVAGFAQHLPLIQVSPPPD